jgi:ABC-type transporter Mla MlaB component
MDAPRQTITFSVHGPIARGDLDGLCARVRDLLGSEKPSIAFCDVGSVDPDAVTVEALARLQLAAQRFGCLVRLVHASKELADLVGFMGLRDVLPS